MNIKELLKHTGLKEAFVRKCLREIGDVFEPHIKRGSKNAIIFDSNAVAIFDRIKHEKSQGYSLTSIKDILYRELNKQDDKDGKTGKSKAGKTPASGGQTDQQKTVKQASGGEGEIELRERIHQYEIDKIKAENELEKFKLSLSSMRLLHDGGSINDLHERFNEYNRKLSQVQVILDMIASKTRSGWFGGHSDEVLKMFRQVKELVQECLKG